ncbi:MAG: hypothetical protein WA418_00640 [Bradyrhizobium sp.]
MLRRNLLLSLVEAEFFHLRWLAAVLDETHRVVEELTGSAASRMLPTSARAQAHIEAAFEDAMVDRYDHLLLRAPTCLTQAMRIAHVLAAAVKTLISMIVTENLKDFPSRIVSAPTVEAKSAAPPHCRHHRSHPPEGPSPPFAG